MSSFFGVAKYYSNTSGTDANITTSDLGGNTPQAMLTVSVGQIQTDAPTPSNNLRLSANIGDGGAGDSQGQAARSNNGIATTNSFSAQDADQGFIFKTTSSISNLSSDSDLGFNLGPPYGFQSNGAILADVSDQQLAHLSTFFALNAKLSNPAIASGTSGTNTSTPGNEPDVLIFTGCQHGNPDHGSTTANFSIGAALSDGTMRSFGWAEDSGHSGGNPICSIRNDMCLFEQDATTAGSRLITATVDTFTGTTYHFNWTNSTGVVSGANGLSVQLGVNLSWLDDFTTPTSTGSVHYTLGFEPEWILFVACSQTAINTASFDGNSSGFSIGMTDTTTTVCGAWYAKSGAGNTATSSQVADNYAIYVPNGSGGALVSATLASIDATGFTLDYDHADATGRIVFALAIGKSAPAPSGIFADGGIW